MRPHSAAAAAGLALTVFLFSAACRETPQEPIVSVSPEESRLIGQGSGKRGVNAPLTGSGSNGSKFQGTLTLLGAEFDPESGPVMVIQITGVLISTFSTGEGEQGETVTLSFGPIAMDYSRIDTEPGNNNDCIEIKVSPEPVLETETKTIIDFSTVVLTSSSIPGPGNLIADLICAIDEAIEAGWTVPEHEA